MPVQAKVVQPASVQQVQELVRQASPASLIARGLGRSYGDAAQLDGASAVEMGAFDQINLDLVDFKLEFGYDANGELYVADEISPDSMRLWGKDGMSHDKDIFRKYGSDEALIAAYGDILAGLGKCGVE